jgi:hypothetical protein
MALDFGTVAGVSAATVIVVQALLALAAPSPATRDRVGPFVALVVAILLALTTGGLLVVALATGITAGGLAIGAHDTLNASGVPV